jgi:outer membrane biosynthesis protein TonB
MPILQLPSNPSRTPSPASDGANRAGDGQPGSREQPVKLRTGRYGELEEHEILHLIDALDDERERAQFRESIYISTIICLAVAWFLFYGPRVLWHQPEFRDPIALMKEHDKELTYLTPSVPAPRPQRPVIDRKTMQQLQQEAREAPPTPQPPVQQAPPPPPEEARSTAPPVPQPAAPLPATPKPAQPSIDLPATPKPNFAQNSLSAGDAIRNAARGALSGRSGAEVGAPGMGNRPLQAGAEILSDTQGVDFSAYMRKLHDDIQRNWEPLIPEEVQPPIMKKGITGIRFTILPDGQIGNMILETPSRDVALDRAAWAAITGEGNFPPLPKAFHGPQLELRVGFFYNTPLPQ